MRLSQCRPRPDRGLDAPAAAAWRFALFAVSASVEAQSHCVEGDGTTPRTLVTAPIDDARLLILDDTCPSSDLLKVITWQSLIADVLGSAALTGTPTAPTAAANTDTTQVATTAFTQQEINGAGGRSLTCATGSCDVDQEAYEETKCINIDPDHTTTDWLFFRTERAITVIGIDCIVDAATSVVLTLRECNSNAASCGDTEAAITCGTSNATEASSIDDASVDAGDWMRVTRGTETGTITQAILCVTYTVAD